MGRDKALLEVGGLPMALRAARLLEPLVATVTLIGRPEIPQLPGLRGLPDEQPGLGPLGGISTALKFSACQWNLVVGCDMPYLNEAWLDYLIRRALRSKADALLPETSRGPEPLCAMYHKRCGPAVAAALAGLVRKVTQGLAGVAVETITEDEWKAFDSQARLFKNVNSPADYEEARGSLEGQAAR